MNYQHIVCAAGIFRGPVLQLITIMVFVIDIVRFMRPLQKNSHKKFLTCACFCLSAFRSTDYGTTYTKLNLMPGTTIVVTSFYICPTNKKKVGRCIH